MRECSYVTLLLDDDLAARALDRVLGLMYWALGRVSSLRPSCIS